MHSSFQRETAEVVTGMMDVAIIITEAEEEGVVHNGYYNISKPAEEVVVLVVITIIYTKSSR